jgi:hypothetical protein
VANSLGFGFGIQVASARGMSRLASVLALGVLACSSSDDPRALALSPPWPSDQFRVSGRLSVSELDLPGEPHALALLAQALSELDGFGVSSSIFFPISGGALVPGMQPERAHLVDLDAESVVDLELFYRAATHELVALLPAGFVMREGAVYGCWLDDAHVRPSSAMAAALGAGGLLAPLVDWMRRHGIDSAHIGAATVFTIGYPTRTLSVMRAQLDATPPPRAQVKAIWVGRDLEALLGAPTTTRSGFGDPHGVVHDAIGAVVDGTFESPYYLGESTDRLGRIAFDESGMPIVRATSQVPFLLVVPRERAARTPVLMFQHGMNATRAQALAVANDYARAGFATLATDTLWHGNRMPGWTDRKSEVTGAAGADGFADGGGLTPMQWFFDLGGMAEMGVDPLDGRIVRDNFRQAALDLMQSVRLVQKGGLSAIAAADSSLADLDLDATHVVYTSESFGSFLGVLVLAIEPGLPAGVLSVGGAGVMEPTLADSPYFGQLAAPLVAHAYDQKLSVDDPDALPPAAQRSLALLQAALGPGDPVAFAPRIARFPSAAPKHLLLLQAFSDEVIPNQSGELLAAAAGATAVMLSARTRPLRFVDLAATYAPMSANLRGATVAVVNLDPATHGLFTGFAGERDYELNFPPFWRLDTPLAVDNPTELAHGLAVEFARTLRETGVPSVTQPGGQCARGCD